MKCRDQRICEEATDLWREMFAEPPPPLIDGAAMLALITQRLGDARYERLRSPYLRPSTIVGPAQPRDSKSLG
jgi:hypothetical protein